MTMPRPIPSLPLAPILALALAVGGAQAAAADLPAAPGAAPAAPTAKAADLVDQYCIKCHGSEVYTRTNRKVTSRDGLERQVRRCETALQLRWFDDDIADVAEYLNQQFYRFK